MTKENATVKFLASEHGAQLIEAIKKMSEGYQALTNFFLEATPELFEEAAGNGEKAKKRKREKRDPNAPKVPMSSYLLFSQKHRLRVKEEHPDMTPTEIASELGRIWRAMTQEEKEGYISEANHLRDEFQTLNAEYKKQKLDMGLNSEAVQHEEDDELPEGVDSDEDQDVSDDSSSEEESEELVAPTTVVEKSKTSITHVVENRDIESDESSSSEEESAPVVVVPIKKKVKKPSESKKESVAPQKTSPTTSKSSGTKNASSHSKKKKILAIATNQVQSGSSSKKVKA